MAAATMPKRVVDTIDKLMPAGGGIDEPAVSSAGDHQARCRLVALAFLPGRRSLGLLLARNADSFREARGKQPRSRRPAPGRKR